MSAIDPAFRKEKVGVFLKNIHLALSYDEGGEEWTNCTAEAMLALHSIVPSEPGPEREAAVEGIVEMLMKLFPDDFIEDVFQPMLGKVGSVMAEVRKRQLDAGTRPSGGTQATLRL